MIKAVIFDMYETLITYYRTPTFFSKDMAALAGIDAKKFADTWRKEEGNRSIGKISLEEILTRILKENDAYSEGMLQKLYEQRVRTNRMVYEHLHEEILPLLEGLKDREMKISLISNCFSEEAMVIEQSILYPYFDTVCLSWREGVKKPDPEIFARCLKRLGVSAGECLYVGDGGSRELETAKQLGMHAVQALWYLKEMNYTTGERKEDFPGAYTPLEILEFLDEE